MLKQCSKCHRLLEESEYNWKYKGKKLQYSCKECSREYIRQHYKKNIQYYIDKAHRRNEEVRKKAIKYIGNYLSNHKCVDCGESNILVLEFDHRTGTDKLGTVSKFIKGRGTLTKIIKEISKCDVRCANCHRIRTAYNVNSWRLNFKRP